jgi:hypothetical protein
LCYESSNFSIYPNDSANCFGGIFTEINEQREKENISLYPNPTNNSITISNNEAFISNNPVHITITDNLGNIVFQNHYKGNIPTISLETFSKGIYFVKLYRQGKASINKKVVKY